MYSPDDTCLFSTSFDFGPNRYFLLAVAFRNKQKHSRASTKRTKRGGQRETEKILMDMKMDSTVCQLFSPTHSAATFGKKITIVTKTHLFLQAFPTCNDTRSPAAALSGLISNYCSTYSFLSDQNSKYMIYMHMSHDIYARTKLTHRLISVRVVTSFLIVSKSTI